MVVDEEAARAQVDRVTRSRTFETSEIHRHLLLYLANKTLSGEADRLKEYSVGLEAFGKPPSYDPRTDSIVRLQVGRVRQKLMAYYQTEAGPDEITVTLPKGGFKLSFAPPSEPRENGNGRKLIRMLVVGLVLTVIWAALATVSLLGLRRERVPASAQWTPELESIWAPFLESDRSLLVCLGTPMFVRFPNFGFFRDPKANDWQEVQHSDRIRAFRGALGGAEMAPSHSFTGAGEASAAFLLAKLLAGRRPDLVLTRSNILSWQQITDQNVVFVGPPKFNRQLQDAALTQEIVVEPEGIRNRKPRPGEPEFLEDRLVPGNQSEGETHALISRMRGISGIGELMVIAGNASPDTLAAAEWLTQPLRAKELAGRLRLKSGRLPRYYQVVLKVAFKQGVPVRSEYVFHHALGD